MNQNALLKAIAEGFRKTPAEAILSVLIIAGIILFISLISYLYKYVTLSRIRKSWEKQYNKVVRIKDLTINELDFLDQLALSLVDPMRKILLLQNRNTFHNAQILWEKKWEKKALIAPDLIKKIFGEEHSVLPEGFHKPFGAGRPARYVTSKGVVYSGTITTRKGNILLLSNVKKLENREDSPVDRLVVQDYRGFVSHSVSSVKAQANNMMELTLSKTPIKEKKQVPLSKIYIYPDIQGALPVKTPMILLPNGMAMIENPDGILKTGQTIKVALRTEIKKLYRVNAFVVKISLNRRYAWVKFGYVK